MNTDQHHPTAARCSAKVGDWASFGPRSSHNRATDSEVIHKYRDVTSVKTIESNLQDGFWTPVNAIIRV